MKIPLALPPEPGTEVGFTTLGECSLDYLGVCTSWPAPEAKLALETLEVRAGGQAATAALACHKLGWRSRFIGSVGDDEVAARALEGLRDAGVEVQAVVVPGARTRQAIVLTDRVGHGRSVLGWRDEALSLPADEVRESWIVTSRILLVDATWPVAAARAARLARRAGRPVLVDVDTASPDVASLLGLVDVLIVPATALDGLAGTSEPGLGVGRLGDLFHARVVVVTLGSEGALAWAGGEEIRAAPPGVDVVDTTGAGDAFRGGFAAGWLRLGPDAELEAVLAHANAVGALNCRALGAQPGLPTLAEVDRLM